MTESALALPARSSGTALTRFNALRHGVLSRYTLLPWEEESEYHELLSALVSEHQPSGPTEEHLVEELAGILWRKRRLRLAEAASFRRGLEDATSFIRNTATAAVSHLSVTAHQRDVGSAVRATAEDTAGDFADLAAERAQTQQALAILEAGQDGAAYEQALAALHEGTREWWQSALAEPEDGEDEEPFSPEPAGLTRFLREKVLSWYEERRQELENRPLLRSQALGQALDPERLAGLARYEVHLDRKLERTLAMLLKLKDLRRSAEPT
jgi:hypothetical protein